ncbi:MAG: hypothetical protein RI911_913 [Candidatus Parcubacteria bacterium]|jgi:ribonuclease HII
MKWIVGIDEVGRGPIAGPITVGAVAIPARRAVWKYYKGLKDSKQLTQKQREHWFEIMKREKRKQYAIASVSAQQIDVLGIQRAGNLAAMRALKKLKLQPSQCFVQLDYGLRVGEAWKQKAYIKGDERFPAVALASVCAKVSRDKYMVRMHEVYPSYNFAANKGYGTAVHIASLQVVGLSRVHRRSFCIHLLNDRQQKK